MRQATLFDDAPALRYPLRPGAKERDGASEEAARQVASDAGRLRAAVLQVLAAAGPSTPDEIAKHLGESVLAIRPRCSELIALGRVCKTQQRRENRSGKLATVLMLVEVTHVDRV
jgi:hypothetical protein